MKNKDYQATMAPSVEHATAARKVLCSSPGPSLLFDQNIGINASYERIGKKSAEACDITLASTSVIRK